jgi:CRISPR-associated protein Cas2
MGSAVQFSVFEIEVTPDQWVLLRARLVAEIDTAHDSLRFYFLGSRGTRRIEHVGAKPVVDLEAPLIV